MRNRNATWLTGITISILIGVLVAWLGSFDSSRIGQVPVFALIVGWSYLVNWLVFVPSFMAHSEKYFDLTGAATYISATAAALALSEDLDARAWLVAVLVAVWAARLGAFLFLRIRRDGHDGRFDEMKYDFWQFLMTWTIQALWVSLTASAAFVVVTSQSRVPFGLTGTIGLAIWVAGFSIEAVADAQKSRFKRDPGNKNRFISSGLWAWSRHPNYFGEIVLWIGVLIISLPLLSGSRWFVIVSPVFVYLLLTRISGIPMLQKRANERWGGEAEYQAYVRNTPLLVPRPPRSN